MDKTPQLVADFVAALNRRGFEPLFGDELPQEMRMSALPDLSDLFRWEIRPAPENPWVSSLQSLVLHPIPQPYLILISRYRFAEFEVGPVTFFANTGHDVHRELSRAIFADEGLYPLLLKEGHVQFGQQTGGGYDPVCFATTRSSDGDAPIVQIDHEEILLKNRVRVKAELFPSFSEMMKQVIEGKLA